MFHFSIAIILMGKRELIVLLNLSSWCLVMVERLFLAVPRGCLQFVIVVFPDHTHLLLFVRKRSRILLSLVGSYTIWVRQLPFIVETNSWYMSVLGQFCLIVP